MGQNIKRLRQTLPGAREYLRQQPDSRMPLLRVEAVRILHRQTDRQIPSRQNTEPAEGHPPLGRAGEFLPVRNRTAMLGTDGHSILRPPALLHQNRPSARLLTALSGSCEA